MLGKLSVPGRPITWLIIGQGPIAIAVGGWGLFFVFFGGGGVCLFFCCFFFFFFFFLSSIFSLFFLPLGETARYRLKYYKGPLNPKQPTKATSN